MSASEPQIPLDVEQAPAWAWSTALLLGAAVLALVCATATAVSWQVDRAELEEHRALFLAGSVAAVAERADDATAQRFVEALAAARPDVGEAFVIAQGDRDRFGIGRNQRYSASLARGDRGAALDALAVADPAKVPDAARHKRRIDRYARVITGAELPATPGRARPSFELKIDEAEGVAWHSAQVPVRRPGRLDVAGAAVRASVPPSAMPWLLLLILTLGGWGLGSAGLHLGRGALSGGRHRKAIAFCGALAALAAAFAGGGAMHYGAQLAPQLERRVEDARQVHVAAAALGLDADAIVASADVDFTGAPGPLLGGGGPLDEARFEGATARLLEVRYALGRGLLALVALGALLALIGGHRFLVRASVACRRNPFAYLYVAPSMVGMVVLVFIPFLTGVGLSVFAYDAPRYYFAGLDNFAEILLGSESGDVTFLWTLFATILWTATNVVLHTTIGLGLALILKAPTLRFKKIYRVLLIVPWAIPNYITALIWKGMFNKEFGAVNRFIEAAQGLMGMEPSGVDWLGGSFATAFTANLVTNTWLGFPFMMVISLGALQSIPDALYEAADVDGATGWQKFRHITLPLLKPALFPAIILGSIWTFNMFNIIYLVSGGGPDNSTEILITDAYRAFAELNRYGLAAAYSVIIFVILLVYTLMTNRITRATEGTFE